MTKTRFGGVFAVPAAAALLCATALSTPAPAQAEELRIAVGMSGSSALVRGMYQFADNIEANTDGAYTGKIFEASLLNFAESMTGLRDGIADGAFVVPAYHRAEFPNTNLVGDLATATTDPVVMAGAVNEFMFSCAPCLKEYADQNQVFLGMVVTGPYYMMSVDPLTTPEDFSGKKIRGFGPYGRWVDAMGATPVVLSANDIYEAISQGQLDGNTHAPEILQSLSLGEVVDYLLNEPIGLFNGNSMYTVNKDLWGNLGDDDKRAFLEAAGSATAWATVTYLQDNAKLLADPASVGVELVEPSEALHAASVKFREDDIKTVAKDNMEKHGIADAEAQVARMLELIAKWEGLLAGIDAGDIDAVAELYNAEIFSKVDAAVLN
ncbi:TRAP-type C4-dicarboxylate transport system, substrate-binding protein [Albimonas donghaensis]|uniref:TRAP-type C4-dicarboxylate transport system, substrate-binding protein n=1 Tax=Albimonas donghaensis TaxID=356660 RepID=A0A1H3AGL3_9RHOB|nr:C4-dicarboxylate TRAP transporter substrate-binding protein [Albimonas donghaensis]SDX28468.1 TRAP-type C4-dicarboxylate transport system, substrate-binding protein [Albimonas donghaensis]